MTQTKNSVEINTIRHISPGYLLYSLHLTKSSPQNYGDEFCRKVFNNQNIFNISLLNCIILNIISASPFYNFNPRLQLKKNINKKEERQKKYGEIDSCLKPMILDRCIDFILKCVNMHELTGPGSRFPIRVITWSFNAKGDMVVVETYKEVSFKDYLQMELAAAGLLFYWSLGKG